MKPKCHLEKIICCTKCERLSVCFKNCLFQNIRCSKCDYNKSKIEDTDSEHK